MFIDYAKIEVSSGNGGDGVVTFRREKYVPKGGPSGGNGGNGGSIIFETHPNLSTLLDFKYKRKYFASNGKPGANSLKDGKNGEDVLIKVPVGTTIKDSETGEILLDLSESNKITVFAKGGIGGKGNSNFATPTRRTPRFATNGKPGTYAKLTLELKLIADVGLVGLPNVGKSSMLNELTNAKSKVANYPFTTLEPNLGVYYDLILADIPGLIEGASKGKGLGVKFLRHVERTKILFHFIAADSADPVLDYKTVRGELKAYNKLLLEKLEYLFISKSDMVSQSAAAEIINKLKKFNQKVIDISIYDWDSIERVRKILNDLITEKIKK